MSVYAPDSGTDHEDYENSCRERRKFYWIDDGMGQKRFYIAVDFDIELGLLRIGNEKDEELALCPSATKDMERTPEASAN